jgi:hypothetical protein
MTEDPRQRCFSEINAKYNALVRRIEEQGPVRDRDIEALHEECRDLSMAKECETHEIGLFADLTAYSKSRSVAVLVANSGRAAALLSHCKEKLFTLWSAEYVRITRGPKHQWSREELAEAVRASFDVVQGGIAADERKLSLCDEGLLVEYFDHRLEMTKECVCELFSTTTSAPPRWKKAQEDTAGADPLEQELEQRLRRLQGTTGTTSSNVVPRLVDDAEQRLEMLERRCEHLQQQLGTAEAISRQYQIRAEEAEAWIERNHHAVLSMVERGAVVHRRR